MAGDGSKRKDALAEEVWRHCFGFFMRTRAQRDRVLERLGLTPNDARALSSLEVGAGKVMRALAEEWGCDASNATWMVDRLEARGLAARTADPKDRRVKRVALTPRGAKARRQLQEGMYEPPPELLQLDVAELEQLRAIFERLAPPKGTGDR
ncbi:winged helix DNA-binding protein [Myxococcus sp. CA056]|uniref:MarR family winged helix-turn-helix transcriptional regulator n=1 Tax=Myxococcus sp. CA056 TaxID=2741740 RepID=UPI00157AA7D3|nr:MarR family transcriptional regulator [Myxococcus sp. CA056]NTX13593.1 winged helix DNA-binding protein [Myxococcus sp. CA056]